MNCNLKIIDYKSDSSRCFCFGTHFPHLEILLRIPRNFAIKTRERNDRRCELRVHSRETGLETLIKTKHSCSFHFLKPRLHSFAECGIPRKVKLTNFSLDSHADTAKRTRTSAISLKVCQIEN